MTNTTKLITKLAVAIGLIGSLAFSATTPSLAQSKAAVHQVAPTVQRNAPVDNPPGSLFQDQGIRDSIGD